MNKKFFLFISLFICSTSLLNGQKKEIVQHLPNNFVRKLKNPLKIQIPVKYSSIDLTKRIALRGIGIPNSTIRLFLVQGNRNKRLGRVKTNQKGLWHVGICQRVLDLPNGMTSLIFKATDNKGNKDRIIVNSDSMKVTKKALLINAIKKYRLHDDKLKLKNK